MYWLKLNDTVVNLEQAIKITLNGEFGISFWFAGEQFPTIARFSEKEKRDKAYSELTQRFVDMSF